MNCGVLDVVCCVSQIGLWIQGYCELWGPECCVLCVPDAVGCGGLDTMGYGVPEAVPEEF